MNTREIYNSLNLCCFKGVFPIDRLPDISDTPSCFIGNTDPSYKKEEHWVVLYFDGSHFITNSYCLQGLLTNVCGQYCEYVLHHRAKGHSFEDIVEYLRNRNSDDIVADFVTYEPIDQPANVSAANPERCTLWQMRAFSRHVVTSRGQIQPTEA